MRRTTLILTVALVAATVLSGCRDQQQVARNGTTITERAPDRTLPSGTSIEVTLSTPLTSETASIGDAWSGSTRNALSIDGRSVVPAGSPVTGTVTSVTQAHKGDRAMLDLGLSSVTAEGHTYHVHGTMESVIAGSTRARNLGAIGAATAAGALVGHAIGGSTKGTVIGALVGGGAATGVVSQTKGWQVVLKAGTPLTFTTNESVAVRL
jgi:hypothetical protein